MSHELRYERVFDAAPEEVFDAFTDPEGLEEMYGLDDPGWIVESEGDLRAGAIGVLVPRLSSSAALGLICLMVGAAATNVFVLGASPLLPLVLLLVSGLVAWGRWPQTRTLTDKLGR